MTIYNKSEATEAIENILNNAPFGIEDTIIFDCLEEKQMVRLEKLESNLKKQYNVKDKLIKVAMLREKIKRLEKKNKLLQAKTPDPLKIEGYPETKYIQDNINIILKLEKLEGNAFIESLLSWVKSGKQWSHKQYYYASVNAVKV